MSSDVSREEFHALVERVARLEGRLDTARLRTGPPMRTTQPRRPGESAPELVAMVLDSVAREVDRWQRAGLLTAEQAAAIEAFEREKWSPPPDDDQPGLSPTR
jgi:hypothetical protein